MSGCERLHYTALGGCLAVFLLASPVLLAQERDEDAGQESVTSEPAPSERPNPEEGTDEAADQDNSDPNDPLSATTVQDERSTEETCGPRCQAAEQREKDDLIAQQSMAKSTVSMKEAAWWQVGIGFVALVLLAITVFYTRNAAVYARGANEAAKAAVVQARRQADAAVLLEAAKFISEDANICPREGGTIQSSGIPENGHVVRLKWKNIGKTSAFLSGTAIVWQVSEQPPEYDRANIIVMRPSPSTVVQPEGTITYNIRSHTIQISEEDGAAIAAGQKHFWAFGVVTYDDWFGIEREENFLYRWRAFRGPDDDAGDELGFVTHPWGEPA